METTQNITDQSSIITSKTVGRKANKARPFSAYLDKPLFLIVTMMLVFTVALLSANLLFQHQNYSAGISAALKNSNSIDHAVIISYNRAWDFAVVKISSTFLAFCLILIGALYVLRVAFVAYSLSLEGQATKGSLETGSPGLVMVTLGTVLMAVVLLSTSKVEYHSPGTSANIEEFKVVPHEATLPAEEDLQPRLPKKQEEK